MLNTCFRRVLPLSTCPILGFGLFHLSLTWTLTSHLPRDQYIFKLCYCKVKLMHMVLAISQNWLFSGLGSTCHLLDLWPGVHVTLLNMQQNGTWLLGMDEVKGEKYAIYSMPLALPWWTIIKLCTMPHHHQAIEFFSRLLSAPIGFLFNKDLKNCLWTQAPCQCMKQTPTFLSLPGTLGRQTDGWASIWGHVIIVMLWLQVRVGTRPS